MIGKVHSVETFGAADGPSVRYVVFMQGCPMRCLYCHNPDTWGCDGGEEVEAETLLNRAIRFRPYWKENGGITVSGGEPLMQAEFVAELFQYAKEKDVHTTLDTSGILFTDQNRDTIDRLLKYTDLVMLDIKHIDDEEHKILTGHSNENVLAFAKYLSEKKIPVWIRHVLVPGITAKEETLRKLRSFLDTLENVEKIEVLPYHTMGKFKYEQLQLTYPLEDTLPPTDDEIALAKCILL